MQQPVQVKNSVGVPVRLSEHTTPHQSLFLREMHSYGTDSQDDRPAIFDSPVPLSRLALLNAQEAWVANDEMEHHLQRLTLIGLAVASGPCLLPRLYADEFLGETLELWMGHVLASHQHSPTVVTALLIGDQWAPVLTVSDESFHVFTTPGTQDWIRAALVGHLVTPVFHCCEMSTLFPHDCGFQCIGWLLHMLYALPDHCPDHAPAPVQVSDAEVWRSLFALALTHDGRAQQIVRPTDLAFGGGGDITAQLAQILQEHGVPSDCSEARAQQVVEKLGRAPVTKALRSQHVWKELKSLANAITPRFQLVLPSEMNVVNQERLSKGRSIGSKDRKAKTHKPARTPTVPLHLSPDDISIPNGIFREGTDVLLPQIGISDICPTARGVVVSDSTKAMPFLRLQKPVSQHGLALLLLDHQSTILHGIGQLLRFPAKYEGTGEPILLTAKLVQLGHAEVARHTPVQTLRVDEVPTKVLRVHVYQEEADVPWSEVCAKPVRYIVDRTPALQHDPSGANPILDCWDRQYLSLKLDRCKPESASIFAVSFRVHTADIQATIAASGKSGIYYKPRSDDGRKPSEDHRVVWLGKKGKDDALTAMHSTPHWVALARSGQRFGLRTREHDAHAVHMLHKPNLPYLPSQEVLHYVGGPFPFGATRASLSKVFESWSWNARPMQPKGRTVDMQGTMWEIQASEKPQFEVYQLEHADVLLTEVPKKGRLDKPPGLEVQASAKTLAALRSSPDAKTGEVDHVFLQDPWASASSKQPKLSGNDANIDVLSARIEQKVLQAVAKQLPSAAGDQDAVMATDDKVNALETRLEQLEGTVQTHHVQQTRHNQEVANQFIQVKQQVEQQGLNLQQHFDRSLQQQLGHIEQLLAKKTRLNHE
eukprot:s1534_g2.t1